MTGRANDPERKRSDIEDIAEDVLGFNFRSLRTFWDLIVRPSEVFQAYATRDSGRYTPALRLWLGLTVVLALLSFFFGGNDELILRAMDNWPEAQRDGVLNSIDGTAEDLASAYEDYFLLLQPPIVGGLTALTVFLIALFRRGLSWVARINIAFAVLTVGSLVGLAVFPIMVAQPQLGSWVFLPVWFLYGLTMYRGAKGVLAETVWGRAVKAVLFSTVTIVLVFIAGVTTFLLSLQQAVNALQPPV